MQQEEQSPPECQDFQTGTRWWTNDRRIQWIQNPCECHWSPRHPNNYTSQCQKTKHHRYLIATALRQKVTFKQRCKPGLQPDFRQGSSDSWYMKNKVGIKSHVKQSWNLPAVMLKGHNPKAKADILWPNITACQHSRLQKTVCEIFGERILCGKSSQNSQAWLNNLKKMDYVQC